MTKEDGFRSLLVRYLKPHGEPPNDDVAAAAERLKYRMRGHSVRLKSRTQIESAVSHRVRWVSAVAAAVLLVGAVGTAIMWPRGTGDLYRVVDGAVQTGGTIRTNDAGAQLALVDGSRVEMRPQSELNVEHADDGLRILLSRGGIIVNAAKQPAGHLYVQTRDVTVSVVGTVFLVNAEEEGSRVAVIEGEVRVKQGETESTLKPGEQISTNPSVPALPVKEEVGWSQNADAHIALLLQSASALGAPAVTQTRESFEVASIRPYNPGAPTGGRGGRIWAVGGCSGDPQVDPARFAATGVTLHALIMWAYGTRKMDCREYAALNLISGGPEWTRLDQWDVEAALPAGSPGYTLQQLKKVEAPKLQAMLRTLLEDRFQLVVRREIKEVPAYALTVGKDAASQPASRETSSRIWNGSSYTSQWLTKRPEDWQPYSPGSVAHERGKNNQSPEYFGYLTGSDASMSDLILLLGQKSGRPVLDRTGLTGTFNWYVKHSAEQPPNHSAIVGVLNSGDRAYLFKAVEQLGLKVEETKGAVEILVIERVEKPSEN